MTDADRSQPLNVPRGGRSSRYRTHSSGSLSSSFGSPSGMTNLNNSSGGGMQGLHNKKSGGGSGGNSNIGSMSTSMGTGNSGGTLPQFDEKHAAAGNIFEHRQDWSILNRLPLHKRNAIHIRLEDEGPYGNDETRCFVLSQLSMVGCTDVACTACGQSMVVYDRYPLVDGTLFLRYVPRVVEQREPLDLVARSSTATAAKSPWLFITTIDSCISTAYVSSAYRCVHCTYSAGCARRNSISIPLSSVHCTIMVR